MSKKLSQGALHLLKLIAKEAQTSGWAQPSEPISKLIAATIPNELVTWSDSREVQLSDLGQQVIRTLPYLK